MEEVCKGEAKKACAPYAGFTAIHAQLHARSQSSRNIASCLKYVNETQFIETVAPSKSELRHFRNFFIVLVHRPLNNMPNCSFSKIRYPSVFFYFDNASTDLKIRGATAALIAPIWYDSLLLRRAVP